MRHLKALVTDIDADRQMMTVSMVDETGQPTGEERQVRYDAVSFDIGSRTAFTQTPGVVEHAVCAASSL